MKINGEDVEVDQVTGEVKNPAVALWILRGVMAFMVALCIGLVAFIIWDTNPMTHIKAAIAEMRSQGYILGKTDWQDYGNQWKPGEAGIVLKIDKAGKQLTDARTDKEVRYIVVAIEAYRGYSTFQFYDEDRRYISLADTKDFLRVLKQGRPYQKDMEKKVNALLEDTK